MSIRTDCVRTFCNINKHSTLNLHAITLYILMQLCVLCTQWNARYKQILLICLHSYHRLRHYQTMLTVLNRGCRLGDGELCLHNLTSYTFCSFSSMCGGGHTWYIALHVLSVCLCLCRSCDHCIARSTHWSHVSQLRGWIASFGLVLHVCRYVLSLDC